MKLETYRSVSNDLVVEIEDFLQKSISKFNPLFSSPLWAYRLKKLIFFEYRFLIVRDRKEIQALHLVFEGYRGYTRVKKLPFFLQNIFRKILILFYGYQSWYNFIVFKKNLSLSKLEESKNLIYKDIVNHRLRVFKSPIFDGDIKYFDNIGLQVSKWGTYILSFLDKTYQEINTNYKNSVKKPIKQTIAKGVYIKRLQETEIKQYVDWLRLNQKVTGKKYYVSEEMVKRDLMLMKKNNYVGEIFVAYLDGVILGSLGIWGFGNFVSENGVNISLYSKKNKIYVQELIKDEIVKYCFKNNIKYYDLSGFNPSEAASDKEKAIKFFKEKFNGVEVVYEQIM